MAPQKGKLLVKIMIHRVSQVLPIRCLLPVALLFSVIVAFSWCGGSDLPPIMEPSLKGMIHETGNGKITSDLKGPSSVEDAKHQLERDLYLVIVHASTVLASGHDSMTNPTDVKRAEANADDDHYYVKHKAEAYLRDMFNRMKDTELKHAGRHNGMDQMKRHLYQAIHGTSILHSLLTNITIPHKDVNVIAAPAAWQNVMAWIIPYSKLLACLLPLLFAIIIMRSQRRSSKPPMRRVPFPMRTSHAMFAEDVGTSSRWPMSHAMPAEDESVATTPEWPKRPMKNALLFWRTKKQ